MQKGEYLIMIQAYKSLCLRTLKKWVNLTHFLKFQTILFTQYSLMTQPYQLYLKHDA